MKLYTASYTNNLYTHGDSITQDEYDLLDNKSQFEFWYDTDPNADTELKPLINEKLKKEAISFFDDDEDDDYF